MPHLPHPPPLALSTPILNKRASPCPGLSTALRCFDPDKGGSAINRQFFGPLGSVQLAVLSGQNEVA